MPLFWFSIAFLSGIVLSSLTNLSITEWIFWSILPIIIFNSPLIIREISSKLPFPIFKNLNREVQKVKEKLSEIKILTRIGLNIIFSVVMIGFLLGVARYQAVLPEITESHIAWYNKSAGISKIVAVVNRPPDRRDSYINLWVDAESIIIEGENKEIEVEGQVLAQVPIDSDFHYGDKILLKGELREPPENESFSYKDYLARQGIYSRITYADVILLDEGLGNPVIAAVYAFKENALNLVYRFYPDPEASIMAGILLGVETGITKDLKQAFLDTGSSHIIAISGFNMTIVAGLISVLFSRILGKRRGAIAAVVGIGVYTILVGADPAVVRAAIMGGLSLFARQVGRRQDGLNSLAFTAALMCMFNPYLLWDVGFQLSVMATLGLVLYAEPFKNQFEHLLGRWVDQDAIEKFSGPVGEYFLFTIAAQLTILPVVAYHFQRVSLSSFPVNILILPAQAFIMVFGGLAILIGSIFFPIGQLISYLAWPFIAYTIRIVEWFSQFRGGVIALLQVGLIFVFSFYILLFVFTIWGKEILKKISDIKPIAIFILLGFFTIMLWQEVLRAPDGKLHITMMDVGTGDAVLIQSPEGKFVLVNGGPSAQQLSGQIGPWLPIFHRKLDFLILASTEENQIKGLPDSIERFLPNQILWAGAQNASRSSRYLEERLTELQVPILTADVGQILDLGKGAELKVLSVGSRGAILMLTWDNFRLLMPLGMSFEEMENFDMGGEIGPVTALILADNGFGPLNPTEWISNLNPQIILLSIQAGDYDGLPSQETLDAIAGYPLLRTDLNGWISIETDGQEMWIEAEENNPNN